MMKRAMVLTSIALVVYLCFGWGYDYGQKLHAEELRKKEYDAAVQRLVHNMSEELTSLKSEHQTMKKLWVNLFGEDFDPKKLRSTTVEVSSYNPLSGQTDDTPFEAAFGNMVKPGIIAVPQAYRIKMGWEPFQVIMIEEIGPMIVADHMNGRYGANVDIICFIPKWSEMWGRKKLKVWWQA